MAAIHARTATLSWIGNVTVTAAPPVLFPMPSGLPGAQTRVSHVAKTGQRLNDRGTEQTLVLLELDGTGVQSRNTTVRSGLHPARSKVRLDVDASNAVPASRADSFRAHT